MKYFKKPSFLLFLLVVGISVLSAEKTHASANIVIISAKITSANTVLVTLDNTMSAEDLTSAVAANWHIDVNNGGTSPLTPTSAAITSPDAPATVTLTFAGTPFSNTATSYSAALGLYASTGAANTDDDTNIAVPDSSSIAIADGQAPTLAITLSDDDLAAGETSLVTFTFSETPTGFSAADVTVQNGTLGAIDATNPLVQTATFTPSADTTAATNVITVGTGWTDSSPALNAPAGVTTSANYAVNTTVPVTTQRSSTHHSGSHSTVNNLLISSAPVPAVLCPAGDVYNSVTGQKCNAAVTIISITPAGVTPSVAGVSGYAFGTATIKEGSTGEACMAWQKFFNDHGKANLVVDGICGPKTIAFAKTWQASVGLKADGLLGPISRAKAMMMQ